MPKTSEAQKKATMKWRANNPERYLESLVNSRTIYYNKHIDSERKRCRDKYYYRIECQRLRSILL
jgi:transcription initiation factor IIE alpha subunit